MSKNNNKETTTAINFDSDWRYIRLTNSSSYDEEFISSDYNDEEWTCIQLPHSNDKKLHKFTSTCCVSYWYRKRFELHERFDTHQNIYLHFESILEDNKQDNNESDMKIPAVTIWLNERKIFRSTLPEPINLTKHLVTDSQNVLVIHSKQGFRLRLHARLLVPRRLSGQIDLDDLHTNPAKKGRGKTVDYEATFDDSDGLIALFISAVQKHAKKTGIDNVHGTNEDSDDEKQQLQKIKNDETVEVKAALNSPIPRLAILMLIVGTRGDVQPFMALAKALLACGHRVRLATHGTFRTFVRENGIEFYPLAGDPADLMSFMVKNAGIVPTVSSIVAGDISKNRRVIAEILASTWKACKENDDETDLPFLAEAIIANPPSYGHIHCAQKLQIPLHIVFTMPWSATVQFPHPFCKVDYNREPSDKINMLSYDLVEILTWSGMHSVVNEFRKKTLGLPSLHTRQAVRLMVDEQVPFTYCWSPSLVPKPHDWASYIDVSGFFFLDLGGTYTPPEDLMHFLQSGDPPIYIGFGSITGHDSDRILQVVFEALKITGYRALISGFDVDHDKLPDNVLKIGNCPHDWLFQHVAAVCHHGGAGTTAAGLRAGKPTIIVPFFGDQFFWGAMISKNGAGPVPVPGKTVTVQQLVAAFEFAHEPTTQAAALKISTNFQNENGCEVAVRSFHAHLPLAKMHSDLEPSFSACFRLNDYNLQISRPVAQVLVAAEMIEEFDLSQHHSRNWHTTVREDPFESFARGFKRAVSKITSSMHRSKRARSTSYIERQTSRKSKSDIKGEYISVGRAFKDCLPLYGDIKEKSQEQDEDSKIEKKVKHTVHYGLATLTEKPPMNNHRHSAVGTGPSPAINVSRKTTTKLRINNISRNLPNSNHQPNKKKTQNSLLTKPKPSPQSNDKNNNKSPEQKAADMSGFSINVCKKILTDFKQMKQDRLASINNEKPSHRYKIPSFRRTRSRSTDAQ